MRSSVYIIESDVDAGYCSYPSVPYWNDTNKSGNQKAWEALVKKVFNQNKSNQGISLYIHLPFCESKCAFCCFNAHTTKNHNVEEPYIEHLINEWKLYCKLLEKKPHIKQLHLGGGSPTFFSSENLKKLLVEIFSKAEIDTNAIMTFEMQINSTTKEHLIELNKLGFTSINIGIQDFDPRVQNAINQIQTFEDILKITKAARLIGYRSICFELLFGLPHQTRKTIIDTIYKIRELKPERISLNEYIHAPVKNKAQQSYERYLPLEPEKKMFLKIYKNMLLESGYIDIGMNQFVQKTDVLYSAFKTNSLHRNIMGYSSQAGAIVVGLGVSAISDAGYASVQNERTIKAYYHSIDKKKLPVANGCFLNKEDFIIRKHILNLQCKFKTTWGNSEEEKALMLTGINRIRKFEKCKWLKISDNSIKIRKEGRDYIRNICSAFDPRIGEIQNITISDSSKEVLFGVSSEKK
ncbi:MAG: hypothetical protein A3F72_21185 [Bacteroidetes bacterium RIFCSPLOWO2_12_FULL_35_15]|nr:MAG: hypothetical protein A3F72_21185 [Bacteroidetes bacterium RIFCSPLOWO2_12_FULL_35_15]